ncbi:glutathione S-transferase [Naematelia encephala]|uniref:glutathione transferase n=1 Tax=Naematelia encephala TaxID=71784 RepID=A0A1Y2AM90_9TREE|nr:glutathione S-transferase [Naematelia encephala]
MLILHGSIVSTCTQRVTLSLLQIGLVLDKDFKINTINLPDTKTPEWLDIHPFGVMPYLEDTENGQKFIESRSIAKYVALKYKSPLVPSPTDPVTFAKFDAACSIEQANFDPFVLSIFMEGWAKPMRSIPNDEKVLETQKAELHKKLEGYNLLLGKSRYVAGDQLTLADLYHIPYGIYMVEINGAPGLTDGTFPHVKRWWDEISALESWKTVKKMKDEAWAQLMAAQAK